MLKSDRGDCSESVPEGLEGTGVCALLATVMNARQATKNRNLELSMIISL